MSFHSSVDKQESPVAQDKKLHARSTPMVRARWRWRAARSEDHPQSRRRADMCRRDCLAGSICLCASELALVDYSLMHGTTWSQKQVVWSSDKRRYRHTRRASKTACILLKLVPVVP